MYFHQSLRFPLLVFIQQSSKLFVRMLDGASVARWLVIVPIYLIILEKNIKKGTILLHPVSTLFVFTWAYVVLFGTNCT